MNPPITNADALSRRGTELLAAASASEAAQAFRAAIAADSRHVEAHHGLVRALRAAGRLEESIGAALALTVLMPQDPLAHRVLSDSLRAAGHMPEANTAAARARVLQWKLELQSMPGPESAASETTAGKTQP